MHTSTLDFMIKSCMYAHIAMYICVCLYSYIYIFIYLYICACICVCVCVLGGRGMEVFSKLHDSMILCAHTKTQSMDIHCIHLHGHFCLYVCLVFQWLFMYKVLRSTHKNTLLLGRLQ